MKIILDSNVIIAAFAGRGLFHSIFELCLDRYTVVISDHILSEVHKNLCKKLRMPKQKADRIVSFLNEFCIIEDYDKLKKKICRDKDDDEILGLAKSSEAQYIISGDQDMLILEQFEITKIVSPRQFWEIAKQSAT